MTITLRFRRAFLAGLILFAAGCSPEAKKEAMQAKASAFFKAGEFEKAEIEFKNLLQLDPKNAVAVEHLGLVWLERGAPWRALPYVVEAGNLSPGNRELHLKKLKIVLALGKLDEARGGALDLLRRHPDYLEAILLLTETVRGPEQFKVARQILAASIDRGASVYHLATANLALFDGDMAGARTALRRAVALGAKSPQVHSAMAAFHRLQNNPVEMGQELKLAAELTPLRSEERLRYLEYQARTGEAAVAIAELQDITRKVPDYLPAWSRLAQIAISDRKFDEALAHLQKALRVDPTNYECREVRAQLWLARGDLKKAVAEMEELARDFPSLAAPRFELARLHLLNRDEPQARTYLKEAIVQNPNHDAAIVLLASLTLRAGDAQGAAVALGDLLTQRPHYEPAQMMLLDALGTMSRFDEILRILAASIGRAPDNPRPYFLLGLVFLKQEKLVEARRSFEKSLELAPDALPVVAELVKLDLKARDSASAMRRVQAELTRKPDSAAAHLILAGIHAVQGQWDQVETAVLKTLELDPGNTNAYGLLARAILTRKDPPKIVERVEGFLATSPGNPAALAMAGDIYLQLGRDQQAKDVYEKTLAANPHSTLALNNLAFLYSERLNQPDRALELGQRARQRDPVSPVIADTLGWILFKRKDFAGAVELLQESASKMPDSPEVQYHLGMASQMAGKNEVARAAFQRAADSPRNFPGKEEIKARLAQLEGAAVAPPPGKN